MADADDVLGAARTAFEDAHRHRDDDLAAARTPAQARALQDNHDAALSNYLAALRTAFTCADPGWTAALAEAQAAQQAVAAARAAAEKLAARIAKLGTLTAAVTKLIAAAR